jgi:hypothetical protein
MPKQRGQDRERIEVGHAFDCLAIAEHESIHVGPFDDAASDTGVKPELDEHQAAVAAPSVDVSA